MASNERNSSTKGRVGQQKGNKVDNDFKSREEHYKRMNEELEARSANQTKELEEVKKAQTSILSSKSRIIDNIDTQDFLRGFEDDTPIPESFRSQLTTERNTTENVVTHIRPPSSTNKSRPSSSNTSRPSSKVKNVPQSKPTSTKSNIADDKQDETFMTRFREFSLAETIDNIEGQMTAGAISMEQTDDDDVMPAAAADMGSEAQIRFLKAKLRVMQEEVDKMGEMCKKKDEENARHQNKIKEIEEEKSRLHRLSSTQQAQIDKHRKLAEDATSRCESTEGQLVSIRKDFESVKRNQKQQTSTQSATEVRLNRALEELAKTKDQLTKASATSKESGDQDKRKVEALMAENKRLEKQKSELMTGFKKQLKLIDVLKRQKMHIEAAKMLAFSEEEFVKALEWGN